MASDRRRLTGLVVDKSVQFRLAVACSTLIVLPALLVSVSLMSNLALGVKQMVTDGVLPVDVAQTAVQEALVNDLWIIGIFVGFSLLSIYLSLKMSNQMIGPVRLLESQVEDMIRGQFKPRRNLRKGDYLATLADHLNQLSQQLREKSRGS